MILIAALLLAGYAFVQSRRQAAREADPYYGMVEVFNGDELCVDNSAGRRCAQRS